MESRGAFLHAKPHELKAVMAIPRDSEPDAACRQRPALLSLRQEALSDFLATPGVFVCHTLVETPSVSFSEWTNNLERFSPVSMRGFFGSQSDNDAVQNVSDDEVKVRFGLGESLLRSTRLGARCVCAFHFLAFVHLVRRARVVIFGHARAR
jgi:hypothetical protein